MAGIYWFHALLTANLPFYFFLRIRPVIVQVFLNIRIAGNKILGIDKVFDYPAPNSVRITLESGEEIRLGQ